ncbi:Protein kinase, putative [Hondaea fermentalgiana]|uniref:Protein kinase, putative n=1 Tax=Hondaea fermentalgiana TaxID=2315210 RepID=A0A2R5GST2_9STRA|nr:Protein kinase, putative [Hondaea fermentalgiana]|eukprot:GBG33900.1 Protein kinase, putative [Hondaea fermentalgiana]
MASMFRLIKDGDLAGMQRAVQNDPALLNATVTTSNDPPLTWALDPNSGGQPAIAHWLIERGAKLDLQNNIGWTALMYACRYDQPAIAQWLIKRGAKLDLQDNGGWTALMYACRYDQPDTAQLLIENGADFDLQASDGWTALMLACQQPSKSHHTTAAVGLLRCIKLVYAAGADLDLKTRTGWDALAVANYRKREDAVAFLKFAAMLEVARGLQGKLQESRSVFVASLQTQESLGIEAGVPRELTTLGLWLTNAKRGDFETIAELASKPGKSVLKVRDPNGQHYVLKTFHLANDEWSSRFFRQVAALAQMQSAYIVRIQGAFMQDAHQGCVLMPLYEGGDLAAWIRDNMRADVATRRRIAIGLLSGLHDLHSQGFVHCDVKPENVFLAPGLSPVLGDFDGVQMHNVTMTQPMQATFKYMAPELRDRKTIDRVDSAVDMYSVGVVLEDLFQNTTVSDATTTLISSLQSEDPAQRPTALEALRHEAFQVERVKEASCAICFDIYPADEGISCADRHFTCKDCLSESVRAAAQSQSHVKVLRDGSMCCVTPDCDLVIPGRSIAAAVPDEDFSGLLDIVRAHFERDAAAKQERQLRDRVDAALREHGLDPTTQNHIRTIQNEVLAMSCPRCSTVFADFGGCCALTKNDATTAVWHGPDDVNLSPMGSLI